ncbi:MAG: hypothetical protein LAQ69_48405 [Acidobacteriia bacterium]|nr:hypothetical protein [Terriglobia bacterium]
MTRILHILRKDARHLWPHTMVFLTLMALAAILDPTYINRHASSGYSLLVEFALPLACCNLVIAVIHEEKLPGDRQYWLTRPYSWKELLAAKALFVLAFINVPLFLWHAGALMAAGIPLPDHLAALLWRQVFFSALNILPVAALAAITRSLGQVMLTALVMVLPLLFAQQFTFARYRMAWGGSEWMMSAAAAAVLAAGVAGILALQYSRRKTAISRVLAGAVALAILIVPGGHKVLGRPRQHPEDQPIRISLDPQGRERSTVVASGQRDIVTLDIPVRVEGIPAGVDLIQNHVAVWTEGAGKRTWNSNERQNGGFHDVAGGSGLTLFVERSAFEWLRASDQKVYGSAVFTAFGHAQVLPLPRGHRVVVPRVGVCSDTLDPDDRILFVCYTPSPRASLAIETFGNRVNWIIPQGFVDASVPTSSGFQPLMRFSNQLPYLNWQQVGDSQLVSAEPLPPIEVNFELPGVRLADYVVGGKQR